MPQHVDKLDVSIRNFDGPELIAQGFELTAAVNAIPSILVNVLPAPSKSGRTTASAPTFKDLTENFNIMSGLAAKSDSTADISISISSTDDFCGSQRLDLKGWVLTDVGLSSVTTYSAPTMTAMFRHPIVRLSKSGEIYEIPLATGTDAMMRGASGDDIVSLMDSVYRIFADQVKYYGIDSGQESRKYADTVRSFRKALSDPKNLPGTYLECDVPLFMEKIAGASGRKMLVDSLARMIKPFFGNSSTWTIILQAICSRCLMQLVPTYDLPKLRLEPLSPWQSAAYEIPETSIEAIDLPCMDPDPICGVAVQRSNVRGPAVQHRDTAKNRDANASDKYFHAFYFPPGVDPSSPQGRIEEIGPNWVISSMTRLDPPKSPKQHMSMSTASNKISDAVKRRMEDAYSKAIFECLYRRGCASSVVTSLLFDGSGGKRLYPGRTLAVYETSNHDYLFRGYVSKITCRGSVDGSCTTQVEMINSRPAAPGSVLVEEGTENGCF